MSKSSSSKTSKTDWPRLKAMQDTTAMTENEFRQLIARSEGETLDFKEAGYDLKNSRNKFIKDVLAMANTPRLRSEPERRVSQCSTPYGIG